MAFGKPPLTAEQKARLRAQATAMLEERRRTGHKSVPAVQPYIEEELAFLQTCFGKDRRLVELAVTFAMIDAMHGARTWDREAVIEAEEVAARLDARHPVAGRRYASWARRVAAAPPKTRRAGKAAAAPKPPFARAAMRALELYWAFQLTNARARRPAYSRCNPDDSATRLIIDTMLATLARAVARGARFDRSYGEIVFDWVGAPRLLKRQYRPSASLRAPLAFLARSFHFDLDDELRRVGREVVHPSVVRRYKRRKLLDSNAPLTEGALRAARDGAAARMRHAPPAGFLSTAGLGDELTRRQDLGRLANVIVEAQAETPEFFEACEALLDAGLRDDIKMWAGEPVESRPSVPNALVAATVPLSPRSVDGLVKAYESVREKPFDKQGQTTLIPEREVDAIVAFANERAARRRSGHLRSL